VAKSRKKPPEANYGESMKEALESLVDRPAQKVIEYLERSMPSIDYQLPTLRMPDIQPLELPTPEERNEYQSAGVLMRRLADSIMQWRQQLPSDQQPAILAILNGGIQITVERLAEESFHGIRLEGSIGSVPCMVLAHQATLQLLCYIEKIESKERRRRIGFIIDGKEELI
jgi:hypothetical protein